MTKSGDAALVEARRVYNAATAKAERVYEAATAEAERVWNAALADARRVLDAALADAFDSRGGAVRPRRRGSPACKKGPGTPSPGIFEEGR